MMTLSKGSHNDRRPPSVRTQSFAITIIILSFIKKKQYSPVTKQYYGTIVMCELMRCIYYHEIFWLFFLYEGNDNLYNKLNYKTQMKLPVGISNFQLSLPFIATTFQAFEIWIRRYVVVYLFSLLLPITTILKAKAKPLDVDDYRMSLMSNRIWWRPCVCRFCMKTNRQRNHKLTSLWNNLLGDPQHAHWFAGSNVQTS